DAGKIQRSGIKEPGIVGKTPVLASELDRMSARRDADVVGHEHRRVGASLWQIRWTAQVEGAGDIEAGKPQRGMAAGIEPIVRRLQRGVRLRFKGDAAESGAGLVDQPRPRNPRVLEG